MPWSNASANEKRPAATRGTSRQAMANPDGPSASLLHSCHEYTWAFGDCAPCHLDVGGHFPGIHWDNSAAHHLRLLVSLLWGKSRWTGSVKCKHIPVFTKCLENWWNRPNYIYSTHTKYAYLNIYLFIHSPDPQHHPLTTAPLWSLCLFLCKTCKKSTLQILILDNQHGQIAGQRPMSAMSDQRPKRSALERVTASCTRAKKLDPRQSKSVPRQTDVI